MFKKMPMAEAREKYIRRMRNKEIKRAVLYFVASCGLFTLSFWVGVIAIYASQ